MIKQIIVIIVLVLLSGCSWFGGGIRTETQIVERPILYCPAPNYQPLPNVLPIDLITDQTSDGEVVVRYKATVKFLKDHAKQLELILEQYKITHITYEELRQQILNEQ